MRLGAHHVRHGAAHAAVYFGWGSTYLAIRYGIESFPPLLMQGARFLLAGAVLYAWARARGAERPTRSHWRAAAVVGALLPACGSGGVAWAEQMVSSGVAAVLIATEPLWIVLLTWLIYGERPTGTLLLGVGLGFAGVATLSAPGRFPGPTSIAPLGITVLLLAALSWAVGSIYSRGARLHPSGPLAAGMSLLAAGTMLTAAGVASGETQRFVLSKVSTESVAAFAYLVTVGSLLAFSAYLWLTRMTTLATASTYAFVNPVVALALGWLVAGEALTARATAAAASIVLAVFLVVVHGPGRRERSVTEPGARERLETRICVEN